MRTERDVEETAIAVAAAVMDHLRNGAVERIEPLLAPPVREVVSADVIRLAWETELATNGPIGTVGDPEAVPTGTGLVRVRVPVTCERGGLELVLSVDAAGAIQGMRLARSAGGWEPPAYASPGRFEEVEVELGEGGSAVGATLTLPRRRRPVPGVVLLAGGGPFDRNGSIGVNRPLQDLAWGLGSRGVAVIRFDKVTFARSDLATAAGFNPTEEYLPHALAAIGRLRDHPGVDGSRIVVAGHSMGGRIAPRVAEADPSVAGLVLLAADAEPMHRAAVRVVRHLAEHEPGPGWEAALGSITAQADLVGSAELSESTPAARLPFGLPASYWLDIRDDDPVARAARLDVPLLILQGGRDYQVTVAEDLARWRSGLAGRPATTIRVLDRLDHFFLPGGPGPSLPSDHTAAAHVDRSVVVAITRWLKPGRGRSSPWRRAVTGPSRHPGPA